MRRVSSAGSLSSADENVPAAGPYLRTTPPLSKAYKHTSHPNLAVLDVRPSRYPMPLARKSSPNAPRSQGVACHALPLDALAQAGLQGLQDISNFLSSDVQLESTLHIPAGQAEHCLFEAKRVHSASMPAPSPTWHPETDTLSAEWILTQSAQQGELSTEELSQLAACLAAPPDVEERREGRAEERSTSQRLASAPRALTLSDATRLSTAQEAANFSDRFSDLLRRVRRRRRNEQIAELRKKFAPVLKSLVPSSDDEPTVAKVIVDDELHQKGAQSDRGLHSQLSTVQEASSQSASERASPGLPWPCASPAGGLSVSNPLSLLCPTRMLSHLGF